MKRRSMELPNSTGTELPQKRLSRAISGEQTAIKQSLESLILQRESIVKFKVCAKQVTDAILERTDILKKSFDTLKHAVDNLITNSTSYLEKGGLEAIIGSQYKALEGLWEDVSHKEGELWAQIRESKGVLHKVLGDLLEGELTLSQLRGKYTESDAINNSKLDSSIVEVKNEGYSRTYNELLTTQAIHLQDLQNSTQLERMGMNSTTPEHIIDGRKSLEVAKSGESKSELVNINPGRGSKVQKGPAPILKMISREEEPRPITKMGTLIVHISRIATYRYTSMANLELIVGTSHKCPTMAMNEQLYFPNVMNNEMVTLKVNNNIRKQLFLNMLTDGKEFKIGLHPYRVSLLFTTFIDERLIELQEESKKLAVRSNISGKFRKYNV